MSNAEAERLVSIRQDVIFWRNSRDEYCLSIGVHLNANPLMHRAGYDFQAILEMDQPRKKPRYRNVTGDEYAAGLHSDFLQKRAWDEIAAAMKKEGFAPAGHSAFNMENFLQKADESPAMTRWFTTTDANLIGKILADTKPGRVTFGKGEVGNEELQALKEGAKAGEHILQHINKDLNKMVNHDDALKEGNARCWLREKSLHISAGRR